MANARHVQPAEPGLISQAAHLSEGLRTFTHGLDPDRIAVPDAARLYARVTEMGRFVEAAKTVLAPRIAASELWRDEGHRSPAEHLAAIEGVPTGEARRTIATGRHLVEAPGVEAALREGRISGPQAALLAETVAEDPRSEGPLLAGAGDETFTETRERCRRAKAARASEDPKAVQKRIFANRSFHHHFDPDGTFRYWGTDTAQSGTEMVARIEARTERLRRRRRTAAVARAGKDAVHERGANLRQDAVMDLLLGRRDSSDRHQPDAGDDTGDSPGTGDSAGTGDNSGTGDSAGRPAGSCHGTPTRAQVLVHVDLAALRRGHALPEEACGIDGAGPTSIDVVEALMNDATLALIYTDAGDIRSISHHTRVINNQLRAALAHRDRTCVVPGCLTRHGLEIDHLVPFGQGGPTTLDNLARLCNHHHRLKTYEGWTLTRHGPTDADPQWSFDPQPPFGQEPDLGLDRRGTEPPDDQPEPVPLF